MRGRKRPEALRQARLNQGATSALEHVKVSSFNHGVVLGFSRPAFVVHNANIADGRAKLTGFVSVTPLHPFGITEEVS